MEYAIVILGSLIVAALAAAAAIVIAIVNFVKARRQK